jgi:hypothetical protein
MAKKIIQQQPEEIEPKGTQEEEAQQQEEVQEVQPVTKPKRVLTEKQLESLARAREAAAHKKRELKELAQKAKALPKKEIEVKAAEYDKLEAKKQQLTQAPQETKPIKKVKKVIQVEEDDEEEVEVVVKKQTKKVEDTFDKDVSMLSIQQKLKLERQKMLINKILLKSFISFHFRVSIYYKRVMWFTCRVFI